MEFRVLSFSSTFQLKLSPSTPNSNFELERGTGTRNTAERWNLHEEMNHER